LRKIITLLCLTASLSSQALAQSDPEPHGQVTLGLNFSTLGQDINASYSNMLPFETGSISYSFGAEKHTQAEYDVASVQITHSTNFELSKKRGLNLTLPFTYDKHPKADFSHYAVAPRLSLISSFQNGTALTTFVEYSVDRGSIEEQHHSSLRIGAFYRFPINKTVFEVASSVARLNFENADDHNTFTVSISASRPIGEKTKLIVSTTVGEDFEKFLRGGEIYRNVTKQELISISLNQSFSNFDLIPYLSLNSLKSEFFDENEITAGFRTNWKF
jgi:hypothetical protein